MRTLAVLTEALAVIRRDEHDRARERTAGVERAEHAGELPIDRRDLTVVRQLRIAGGEVRRRLVRRVRIVVVDPQKPRRRWRACPSRRLVGRGSVSRSRLATHVMCYSRHSSFLTATIFITLKPRECKFSSSAAQNTTPGDLSFASIFREANKRLDGRQKASKGSSTPEFWKATGKLRRPGPRCLGRR